MILIVCGVSGTGKTTIGRLLAVRLGCDFLDADDFHPAGNVAKMRAGTPLTDADREPWLARLAEVVGRYRADGKDLVLACSALRAKYRMRLGIDQQQVVSVLLDGSPELIASRLAEREHAYMPAALLASQFQTLERPTDGIIVDVSGRPDEIVDAIVAALSEQEGTRE